MFGISKTPARDKLRKFYNNNVYGAFVPGVGLVELVKDVKKFKKLKEQAFIEFVNKKYPAIGEDYKRKSMSKKLEHFRNVLFVGMFASSIKNDDKFFNLCAATFMATYALSARNYFKVKGLAKQMDEEEFDLIHLGGQINEHGESRLREEYLDYVQTGRVIPYTSSKRKCKATAADVR